jgi:hypothetical protein
MNTYEYKIINMQRNGNGIVRNVSFSVTASDGVDSVTRTYSTNLPEPIDTPIDYTDLTETQVITWVKDLVGTSTEERLAAYIISKNEGRQNGMPWAA